ncbi:hypothetical protein BGX28_009409 [Mortierella sp. GBA30]|nr:hypothetical protein BGX28_009409 [Mortierella sp. GBA30]
MIPILRRAACVIRSPCSGPLAHYTTRSNGAAFLNNLDFLAPAPSSRTSTPSPSRPQSFQHSQKNNLRRNQPNQGSNRDFLPKNTLSSSPPPSRSRHAIDDIDIPSDTNKNSKPQPSPPSKRSNNHNNNIDLSRNNRSAAKGENDRRPALDRPRRDEEIDSRWIQYVSSEGHQGEKLLSTVLRSFDRSQHFLVEVDSGAYPPICKLFSKKELYEKSKAAKQAKKANELSTKELQLNWGTDSHDLNHKLAKFRAFLEKGHRLEIQVNGKKGKTTTPQERELVMERIKAEFEPVSKYVKLPNWVRATTVTMVLQGLTTKADKAKKQQS